jgi:GNAT superfamily N-acetyltransferase
MEPRSATVADTGEILRLAALMYASMGLDASGEAWREHAAKLLAERLGGDDLIVFVVDDPARDGRLAACGGAAVIQRLPGVMSTDGRWGYIQWMSTDPAYRRRGFARTILTAIVAWLAARGVHHLELHATGAGEPLYRSLGFTDPATPELRRRPSM